MIRKLILNVWWIVHVEVIDALTIKYFQALELIVSVDAVR